MNYLFTKIRTFETTVLSEDDVPLQKNIVLNEWPS